MSEARRRPFWRRLLARRGAITLVFAGALLALIGATAPRKSKGVPDQTYELLKLEWRAEADLVVAGDSRSAGGISPKAMNEVLSGWRILNFAFSGNGLSPEYLDATERVLDPKSTHRALLIGVSPMSLCAVQQQGGYLAAQRPRFTRLRWLYFGNVFGFFAPIKLWDLIDRLRGLSDRGFYMDYHADGWLATRLVPPRLDFTLGRLEREYEHDKIDPAVSERLFTKVREWTSRGIAVYGFRTPAIPAVHQVELKTGFDQEQFIAAWTAAGAHWIELPPHDWGTYDGSHLVPEEAEVLSRMVARSIQLTATSTRGAD